MCFIQDVFTNAAPVKSGIGMFLLQRMGWKQGEGLGKNNEGRVDPLLLDVKTDRKGRSNFFCMVKLCQDIFYLC